MGDEPKINADAKIDIGLKASAEFKAEIKTEIPKEVTGRLVSSLTDIIRPFTESRGLRADMIRLHREDVLYKIALMARQRAEIEQVELHPVPTKMLVPFLEKASTEDADEPMQARWAALLLSASKSYQAKHLTFLDIMSRLSSQELLLMEQTCFAYKGFPETTYPNAYSEQNRLLLEKHAAMLTKVDPRDAKSISEKFIEATPLTYAAHIHVPILTTQGSTMWFYTDVGPGNQDKFTTLQILQREQLIDIRSVEPIRGLNVGFFEVTRLGVGFVHDCSPDAEKMAARRPPPIKPRAATPEEAAMVREILTKKAREEADRRSATNPSG